MAAVAADPTIRRQVISAARELLARDPEAPVEEIARRAGVSRATFYRHSGSRSALLETVAHTPRPDARTRILTAAQDMLVRASLTDLSMDELARAADVSRGTLYRIFPGKAALLEGLIETYSPFEQVRAILSGHRSEPPEVVLPLVARAIVGVAGERLGLLRAVFIEITSGSDTALAGLRPAFASTLAVLGEYVVEQAALGRMQPMHPILAIQSFIGPVFFHLLSRPAIDRMAPLPMTAPDAVEQLVAVSLRGLR